MVELEVQVKQPAVRTHVLDEPGGTRVEEQQEAELGRGTIMMSRVVRKAESWRAEEDQNHDYARTILHDQSSKCYLLE